MGIKGNEKAEKAAKQALDMPDLTIIGVALTDTPSGKGNWKWY